MYHEQETCLEVINAYPFRKMAYEREGDPNRHTLKFYVIAI